MMDFSEGKSVSNGRWTKLQHQKFLLGLQLYGRNWKKIEEMIGSRTGSQIRSHAQKYFLKTNKPFDSSGCLEQPPSKQECGEALPNVQKDFSEENTQINTQFSYFFSRIFKLSNEKDSFNFWDEFIDQKISISPPENQLSPQRKQSFRTFNEEDHLL